MRHDQLRFCNKCFIEWGDDLFDKAVNSAPGIPGPGFLLLRPKCPKCGHQLQSLGVKESDPLAAYSQHDDGVACHG